MRWVSKPIRWTTFLGGLWHQVCQTFLQGVHPFHIHIPEGAQLCMIGTPAVKCTWLIWHPWKVYTLLGEQLYFSHLLKMDTPIRCTNQSGRWTSLSGVQFCLIDTPARWTPLSGSPLTDWSVWLTHLFLKHKICMVDTPAMFTPLPGANTVYLYDRNPLKVDTPVRCTTQYNRQRGKEDISVRHTHLFKEHPYNICLFDRHLCQVHTSVW